MTRVKAVQLIEEYYESPIWNVKIGVCSPQVEHTDFEDALAEFDRCAKFRSPKYLEYVYMYVSDYVDESIKNELTKALQLFDLGHYSKARLGCD